MEPEIRKIVTYKEVITSDGGREAENPLVLFAAAAVIKIHGQVVDLSKI